MQKVNQAIRQNSADIDAHRSNLQNQQEALRTDFDKKQEIRSEQIANKTADIEAKIQKDKSFYDSKKGVPNFATAAGYLGWTSEGFVEDNNSDNKTKHSQQKAKQYRDDKK